MMRRGADFAAGADDDVFGRMSQQVTCLMSHFFDTQKMLANL